MRPRVTRRCSVVLLPATAPDDGSFGRMPSVLQPGCRCIALRFERQVWYNAEVRAAAEAQILAAAPAAPLVLVGFSKSGLGALTLALEQPARYAACVVFDAPVCRRRLPDWGTAPFYDQAGWERDLPLTQVAALARLAAELDLVLISGDRFRDEMLQLDAAIRAHGGAPTLLDLAAPHRWDSGWLEPALAGCLARLGAR